jgi:hypothetical protein
MDFVTLLWCVVCVAGYWGQHFFRIGRRQHGMMLVACAVAAIIGLTGVPIAGAIGIGGATCMLLLSPLLRGMARSFARRENYGAAKRLLSLAAMMAPGAGAEEESAGIQMLQSVKRDGIAVAVTALEQAKRQLPSSMSEQRRAIDERITLLHTATGSWQRAVDHAETVLGLPDAPSLMASRTDATLGDFSMVTWIELLGAHARLGQFNAALAMYQRLANFVAAMPHERQVGVSVLQHRARLLLLANAGCASAVEVLLADRSAHVSPAQAAYVRAVAQYRSGDDKAGDAQANIARKAIKFDSRQRGLIDLAVKELRSQPATIDIALRSDIASIAEVALLLPQRKSSATLLVAPALTLSPLVMTHLDTFGLEHYRYPWLAKASGGA